MTLESHVSEGMRIWEAVLDPEILVGTGAYLLLKPLLSRTSLVNPSKGAYRSAMIYYNLAMAIFSAATFFVTATALGWDRGTGAWLRNLTNDSVVHLYRCPSEVWSSTLFVGAARAFYFSKYVEYLDTTWLVLKGKPVSFLQGFHHFGAPWDMFLGIKLKNEGCWIFLFLNSFIHTIMYTYYAATAAGLRFAGKPLITLMQITQFCGGFYIVWDYVNLPCFRQDAGMMFSWLFNYFYVGSVFLLFCRFFYQDNVSKRKTAAKGAVSSKQSKSKSRKAD